MKSLKIVFTLFAASLLLSCSSQKPREEETHDMEEMREDALKDAENTLGENGVLMEKGGVAISYFESMESFPDARLIYEKPAIAKPLTEGKILFDFNVENYELGMQTGHAEHMNVANSHQGQHIHHILNNEPYTAHYTDTFSKSLKAGHYVQLAFLSRSYHESIKNGKAYILNQFDIGKAGEKVELSGPLMFYSRPKGEYKGDETKNILLDFYLVNTDLSENGNKVRATINGNEFMLTEWRPYSMSGLPMGENTIKLELIDKDGNVIPGPYNTVERKITLKE